MTKQRILHHRTVLHELFIGIALALTIGLPAYSAYFYYRTDHLPDWFALSFAAPFLVFAGFGRGLLRWLKNKP